MDLGSVPHPPHAPCHLSTISVHYKNLRFLSWQLSHYTEPFSCIIFLWFTFRQAFIWMTFRHHLFISRYCPSGSRPDVIDTFITCYPAYPSLFICPIKRSKPPESGQVSFLCQILGNKIVFRHLVTYRKHKILIFIYKFWQVFSGIYLVHLLCTYSYCIDQTFSWIHTLIRTLSYFYESLHSI